MKDMFLALALAAAVVTQAGPLRAQQIGGYSALIGPEDYYNSRGQRLTNPADIIRQDRANVHRFGISHQGDQFDPWFGSGEARAQIPGMIAAAGGVPGYIRNLMAQGRTIYLYVSLRNQGGRTIMTMEVPG